MSKVSLKGHGGKCCGIYHLHGFGGSSLESSQRASLERVKGLIKENEFPTTHSSGVRAGKLFEIVLTDTQIEYQPVLAKGLKKLGFKLVTRFHNNTGGWCNVLHRAPRSTLKASPYSKV